VIEKSRPNYFLMKKLIFLVAILFLSLAKSQNLVTVEKVTKEIIPFVNVVGDQKSTYSNENGVIDLNQYADTIVLTASAIGYKSLKIRKNMIKDTLFLQQRPEFLDTVIINTFSGEEKVTNKLRNSKVLGNQIIPCHYNILSKIISKEVVFGNKISSIAIPFDKHKGYDLKVRDKFNKTKILVRLNIFKSTDNAVGDLLFSSDPKNIATGKNDKIDFSLAGINLEFSLEGFYIQLEHLGAIDMNGNFVECEGLFFARAEISDKKSKEYDITSFQMSTDGILKYELPLNYRQVFGENAKDKNYFLNYRFTYYKN
jgi:hypothetical protein